MTTKRKRSDFASVKSASRKKIPSSKVLQMVLESSDGEHDVNMSCDNERDFTTETSEDEINSETTRELRVDVMDYQDAGDHRVKFHERRISSMTFTSAHLYGNVYMQVGVARALAHSSYFGLMGEQNSKTFVIPCP